MCVCTYTVLYTRIHVCDYVYIYIYIYITGPLRARALRSPVLATAVRLERDRDGGKKSLAIEGNPVIEGNHLL